MSGAQTYLTAEGDVLDWVVWKHYGHQRPGTVELVLQANPGIADLGELLPAGVLVTLPVLPQTPRKGREFARFWK